MVHDVGYLGGKEDYCWILCELPINRYSCHPLLLSAIDVDIRVRCAGDVVGHVWKKYSTLVRV
jgi:DNA-directed RNA polymerase subunit N (RpoN/RPB10)